MEENNKDLSSLLDKFNEKHKEFRAEKNNADKRVSDFKDEFKDIAIIKIKPIMVRYGELLESKNIGYHIGEHFDVRYSPIKDPSISMIIDFNTEASRQASTKPEIRFSATGEFISLYEAEMDPHGSGSAGASGTLTKDEFTDELITEKIETFLRKIFSKDWTKYDFFP